jgi:GTP pyrophosphokinase
MLRFNDVLERLTSYNPQADIELLKKAYVFSAKVHSGHLRLSGEPYLIHPLEVAGILTQLKLDVASVATGFLHDAVEDTLTTLKSDFSSIHGGGSGRELSEDDSRHGEGHKGDPYQASGSPS